MADFCRQCEQELFGMDSTTLAGIVHNGSTIPVICEGCGLTRVDAEGVCLNLDGHHLDERSFGRFVAFLAVIGLCPCRYDKETNILEVWFLEEPIPDGAGGWVDGYTRVIMYGSLLKGSWFND